MRVHAGLRAGVVASLALAVILSLLWWRFDADRSIAEYCADGYCFLAEKFYAVLTRWDRTSLEELLRFAPTYLHAHNPLGPLIQAILALLTRDVLTGYMVMNVVATLVTWILIRRIVEATSPLSPELRALLCAALCLHALIIRSVARPVTDAIGMVCTVAALYALQRFQAARTTKTALVLLGAQFVGLFARTSFIPMLGMPVLTELLGRDPVAVRLRRAARAGLLYGLLPGVLYLGLNATFDTVKTITDTWTIAHWPEFTQFYTVPWFLTSTMLAAQGYAVVLIACGSSDIFRHPTLRVHITWIALYLAFLALGGGALLPRYFLPVVPSVFVLAAPTLDALHRARPWNGRLLLVAFMVGNVLYVHPGLGMTLGAPLRLLGNEVRGLLRPTGAGAAAGLTRLPPQRLRLTASHRPDAAQLAIDGNAQTRWTSETPQAPGMWVQADLGTVQPVAGLVLWTTRYEYPRAYTIETSLDGVGWTRVANGRGARDLGGFLDAIPSLAVMFPSQPARHVRIIQTRRDAVRWWAIHELAIYSGP